MTTKRGTVKGEKSKCDNTYYDPIYEGKRFCMCICVSVCLKMDSQVQRDHEKLVRVVTPKEWTGLEVGLKRDFFLIDM